MAFSRAALVTMGERVRRPALTRQTRRCARAANGFGNDDPSPQTAVDSRCFPHGLSLAGGCP